MSDTTDDAEIEHMFPEGYFPTAFKVTCSHCGRKDKWNRRDRSDAVKDFNASGWRRVYGKVLCTDCATARLWAGTQP